ncbi:hypothetical protein HKX48_008274 [Thoreauomyces humboldtii]|nr:hypothetical protein HKX48_008274 [Thoreauomyces humboldtii]
MGYTEFTYLSSTGKSFNITTRRIEALKVLSVSFLQDWDLVSSANNAIAFGEQASDGSVQVLTASIPVGNYTAGTFPAAIGSAMTAAGTQTYTAAYDQVSRQLTIATNGSKSFKILTPDRGTSAYLLIGQNLTQSTAWGFSIELSGRMNLSGSQPVLLTSNITSDCSRYPSNFNDGSQAVLCAIIPDSFGDVISWENDSGEYLEIDATYSSIQFALTVSLTGFDIPLSSPLTVTACQTLKAVAPKPRSQAQERAREKATRVRQQNLVEIHAKRKEEKAEWQRAQDLIKAKQLLAEERENKKKEREAKRAAMEQKRAETAKKQAKKAVKSAVKKTVRHEELDKDDKPDEGPDDDLEDDRQFANRYAPTASAEPSWARFAVPVNRMRQ